jgi:hypothetical protein
MSSVRKGNRHAMTSEDSPNRKKRKVYKEEKEELVVKTKEEDDEVNKKVKEKEGPARESPFIASTSVVSTQAAAAGLSLLSGGAPYNHYVYNQCKCSYRIRLCIPSSQIFLMVILQPPLFLLTHFRRCCCRC